MSLARLRQPIVAIATASGRGAVGIVRASGADLAPLGAALFGRALVPRVATLLPFTAADGAVLDRGLAIHFPAPHSYTGEDVLELQAHGGPVLLQLLLARVLEAGAAIGLRLADPGEFTERAFLNDKIDLAQAEAVADLIDAGTEAAARSAARSLAGAFSAEIHALAERIVTLRTLVEATLDFPEEEIDFLERAGAQRQLDAIDAGLAQVLGHARQGALLREGMRVVIAGQPNVGKSSLLNALAGAELAIVTPVPGTTRDRVAETIQIEGVPVHVVDTAGLRDEAADEVERIGIGRSWEAIADADAVLFVHDLTRRGDAAYEAAEAEIAARLAGADVLHVDNKADAAPAWPAPTGAASSAPVDAAAALPAGAGVAASAPADAAPAVRVEAGIAPAVPPGPGVAPAVPHDAIALSAKTGAGLDALRRELLRRAGWQAQPEGVFTARARHVDALKRSAAHVAWAQAHAAQRDAALDLLAEELRLAHQALAEITGEFGVEDLLGEIFGRFCIGK